MKTKEELNALKAEVETLNKKLAELTEEELKLVTGGCVGSKYRMGTSLPLTTGVDVYDSLGNTIPGFKPGKSDVHIYKVEKDSDM